MTLPAFKIVIADTSCFILGEKKQNSDLDILISFKERIGLLKLVQIEQELSDKLGIAVDLVTENALKNQRLKKAIRQDLITIYE